MIVGDNIFVMLLVEQFFKSFTKKEIPDTSTSAEAIMGLSADSRAAVDDIVDIALEAGATKSGEPQDHGWMYGRGFQDINGHLWKYFYMDMTAIPQQ